jgi:tRNA(fMet)-specific endonuclease VapC
MKILLLDTNVCIDLIRKSETPVSGAFLNAVAEGHDLVLSSITVFELELGVVRAGNKVLEVRALRDLLAEPLRVVNFDAKSSRAAAMLCSKALAQGRQLSAYDALIAGHAIALGATFVTSDARLAAAVSEVEVVSWR